MDDSSVLDPIFACPGQVAELYARVDWAATPLGPVESWPEGLRSATALMLRNSFAMSLLWGEDLTFLCNDAYLPTLRGKDLPLSGESLREVFPELWPSIEAPLREVIATGQPSFAEDVIFVIEGTDGFEETYYTYSHSPVPLAHYHDGAGAGGVLAVVTPTTAAVVGARRLTLLNDLGTRSTGAENPAAAVAAVLEVLGADTADFARGCWVVVDEDGELQPQGSFGEPPHGWCEDPLVRACVQEARETHHIVVRALTADDDDGPRHVVALPVRGRGPSEDDGSDRSHPGALVGTLLLAPSPLRPLDEDHLTFLGLVADQVGQVVGLADARAAERDRIERLAALDAAKSGFLSSVSHELRTPLTLLLGPLETALSSGAPPLTREEMTTMQRSALRLLRLVEGLLDLATIEAGEIVPEWEQVELAALTADLLEPFATATARVGLRLETELDDAIGTVDLDPGLWETIVLNLVANAVKYTPDGTIRVSLRLEGAEVVLTVTDTGVGIPAEELPHVFDRFHRGSAGQGRLVEGTGLGLALVRHAVITLGGLVEADSTEGSGSTFTARVPARAATSAAGSTARSGVTAYDGSARGTATAADLGRVWAEDLVPPTEDEEMSDPRVGLPTVLVVDDHHAMRRRLQQILSRLGAVHTAADGARALELLRSTPIDLVVADVMMPRLDGLGLLAQVRADPLLATMPVVLVSARGEASSAVEAFEAGADDYLVKPFSEDALLARCRATLELARLRAESVAAARVRATMLAGVSHDMQTPLAVIVSALSLLAQERGLAPEQRALASRAVVRGEQLGRLVHTFLDWSRIATGVPLEPRLEVVEVHRLVERVAADYPGVTVSGDDVPVDAVIDADRTAHILYNLVDNALRAAAGAPVSLRVTTSEDVVEVEVVDRGAGVDPALLPRLFDSFASTSERGTGLGLHVSRLAARAQGGDLALRTTGPSGSVFVVTLPRAVPDRAPALS